MSKHTSIANCRELPLFPPPVKLVAAIIIILLIYGLPVFIAYQVSLALDPIADAVFISPISTALAPSPPFLYSLFLGDYGLISLGTFSFIWAFPVVVFVGLSIALSEQSGIQKRLIFTIEPLLRKIGLSGADFVPVLTGYGCNVVAVLQSKACQSCTRKQCVSMVSFGSACSYQIGATLSIFNAANAPWLFIPYISLLFVAGAIHTRVWYNEAPTIPMIFTNPGKIRKPSLTHVKNQLFGMLSQFFKQAMPIFLFICFIAFLLDEWKIIYLITQIFKPLISILSLPEEAGLGVFFSILRKDGILLFNEGSGALLATFTLTEIFVLIFLASTLSGCLVTIWTIAREFSIKQAFAHTAKQAATSILFTAVLLLSLKGFLHLLG
ncbi:nucleoside recognition domain-containing protein [Evansella halocellulosilytica]|uniref:nucleoside recognition domain-containing protein n=1 Tax=Evansella halocellulosilytica TaxID=2011013 RepID=UPI00211C5410|nr:nucleoside recognition domain-containing protein [Evansella halocellulosilytica]